MIRVRTKIYLIIVLMFLTIITLTASTYAWFEMNTFVNVNDISMTVTEGADLKLSLDGENWKTTLEEEDLYPKLFGVNLYDLTSKDGITITNYNGGNPKAKSYIIFDIYFKLSDLDNVENGYAIYLTNYNDTATYEDCENGTAKGTCIKSKGYNFYNQVEFLYDYIDGKEIIWEDGKYYMAYQEDAIRVSFEDDGTANVFDLSSNPSRGFGYMPNDNTPDVQYGAYQYSYNIGRILDFYNKIGPNVCTRDNLTKYYKNTIIPKASDNNSIVCSLYETDDRIYIGKTTVRIWIEGWDADCFDAILDDSTMIQFEFTFAEKYALNEE